MVKPKEELEEKAREMERQLEEITADIFSLVGKCLILTEALEKIIGTSLKNFTIHQIQEIAITALKEVRSISKSSIPDTESQEYKREQYIKERDAQRSQHNEN